MLEDAPVEQLPQRKSSRGERVQSQIAVSAFNGLSGRLIELAKELGVPVQAVLQSGHFKVLSLLSGQNRAVTCVTHNGRPEELGAERSLGLFLNSVPVALELEPVAWRQMIRQVAEGGARSIEYRGYPLARIQQDTGMELSEVTFNYIHFHVYREMTQTASSQFEVLDSSGYEQTNFDLEVQVARGLNDDTMWLTLVYQARFWSEEFMARLGRYYVQVFTHMLDGLDERHDLRTLLASEEVHQLLTAGSGAEADYSTRRVHELFEEQTARTPGAAAVICGEQRLSYAELNGQANKVARYLRELGVGPDTRVGLCVKRSPEMLAAILGIWKA